MITPTMATAIAEAIDSRLIDVHTALPGQIQTYDPDTQTADVVPMIRRPLEELSTREIVHEDLPVLPNIPVAFPRSASYFISFPLKPGDFVMVLFSKYSIDQWRAKGKVTAPGDIGNLTLTGGVAIPCLYPDAEALAGAHADDMVAGKDGGTQIHIKDGGTAEVTSTGNAAADDFVAQAGKALTELQDVKTDLDNVKSAFDGHIHPDPAAGVTGAPSQNPVGVPPVTITTPHTPASVASSNLKADD